jgi:hypothetical protein
MKKTAINLVTISTVLLLCSLQFGFSSCKKETPIPVMDTVLVLTSKEWKIDEIRFLQNDVPYFYKRGAAGNSANFDNEYIKFNSDFTGTYSADGLSYNITWSFKNGDKTKIEYTVLFSTPMLVNMENIIYNESYFKYSEYYQKNNIYSLATVSRVPK